MGSRSASDTVAAIFMAFRESPTWSQAELAERIGVSVKALKRHLDELSVHGMPLVSEADHPHVYWSVPAGWFPGGVFVNQAEVPDLLRLLARSPRIPFRDRLYRRALASAPHAKQYEELPERVVTPGPTPIELRYLDVLEDAITRQLPVHFHYYSAHRGGLEWRHASILEEVRSDSVRFIARCHRDDRLKWFRLDNVVEARLCPTEPYRPTPHGDVAAFRTTSAGGFHTGDAPIPCTVFVREPECRWAAKNTPCPMTPEPAPGGLRLRADTSALPRLAAWVVSLGAAARAETPVLRALATALAQGALDANAAPAPGLRPSIPNE